MAPESEMIGRDDKGVARVVDETINVELHKGVNKSLFFDNNLSPTTLIPYLEILRRYFAVLPPAGLAAVAVVM